MIQVLAIVIWLVGATFLIWNKTIADRIGMLPATSRIIGVGLLLVGAFVAWAPD